MSRMFQNPNHVGGSIILYLDHWTENRKDPGCDVSQLCVTSNESLYLSEFRFVVLIMRQLEQRNC